MIRNILRYLLSGFMLFAGANHFMDPGFYLPLIPPYLPFPDLINVVSGALEILFGGMLLFPKLRPWGAYGIVGLLVLFIPSHVHFIAIDACVPDGLCTPIWVAWARLVVVHPLLLWWAWAMRK
ncbi:MauE/DoxX family redox-associated membrane protein [Maribacter sp. 2307ULW6-5]|uniref:DoxX family protein n=1 Tax=Maribacter sp. 2307ULW6-5 TaxID=3386275 RepID=UPI0039BC8379